MRIYPPLIRPQDMKYRDACAKYNLKRYEILNEAERAVQVSYASINSYKGLTVKQASVHFHYDFLEAVKGIIIAFANAQAYVTRFQLHTVLEN